MTRSCSLADLRWLVASFVCVASIHPLSRIPGVAGPWLGQTAFQFALGALALAFVSLDRSRSRRELLGLVTSRLPPIQRFAAVVAGLILIGGFAVLFASDPEGLPIRPLVKSPLGDGAYFFGLVVFSPFFEELLFRGALQGMFTRHWGVVPAVVIGSLLFALLHVDGGLHATLFAFAMGVGLGIITSRSGSIHEALAIHAINNLAVFAVAIG